MARDLGGRNPADLIRRASSLATGPQVARKALTNGEAREHAMNVLVEAVTAVISEVDSTELVKADERLSHLTEFEVGVVAELVDKARVTVTCDFDWEAGEASDGEQGD